MVRHKTETKKLSIAEPYARQGGIAKRKWRKGLVGQEIKRMQNSTSNCIPKAPFSRLVKETIMEFTDTNYRIQLMALRALQEASEMYLVQIFEDTTILSRHAKRLTIRPSDIAIARTIKGEFF